MILALPALCCAQAASSSSQTAPSSGLPVSISIYDRTRLDVIQWFAATPNPLTYSYLESLLRVAVAQQAQHWDWRLELAQPAVLGLPSNAVSPVLAQGQLGFGGTYYAAGGNNTDPAAVFLKQGFLRYSFPGKDKDLRLGRFEFFDGLETQPENATIRWLQTNRIAHRLIGNFGFSNGQRSFDGADGHYGGNLWDMTAMAGRADQGVFNMNGNPELNVDIQYLAYSRYAAHQHVLWRAFGLDYHDGRTGILKTDNRPLATRKADHRNIRLGTFGGDLVATAPTGAGAVDFLAWGVAQTGNWGVQSDAAGAAALEAGYQWSHAPTQPWLRGGWFRSSGDNNPSDNSHNTFFQVLPTPRTYARFPFYNLMNNQDEFVQALDQVSKTIRLRADLDWLQLSSAQDLWYQGGGAFDNKVFGYIGRPSNGHAGFATVADLSANWQATKTLDLNVYYAHAQGKSVIAAIYPADRVSQYGYVELDYLWGRGQRRRK